jgi:hypothetical protein
MWHYSFCSVIYFGLRFYFIVYPIFFSDFNLGPVSWYYFP